MIVIICIVILLAIFVIGKTSARSARPYRGKRFDIGKHRKKRFRETEDDDE